MKKIGTRRARGSAYTNPDSYLAAVILQRRNFERMTYQPTQVVGLIELTPVPGRPEERRADSDLEEVFARLANEEQAEIAADEPAPLATRPNRLPSGSPEKNGTSPTSVVYMDADQLERELNVEWLRVRSVASARKP